MKTYRLFALLLATLPYLWANTAVAQDDAAVEMARERFQEGVKFFDQKQYTKARAAFLQAYALKKHPAVLLNLAQSELRSGQEAEAAKHFAQYLREQTEPGPQRAEAQKGLEEAKQHVGEVTVEAPGGAEIFVNGAPHGASPLPGPLYLNPGEYSIEARRGGEVATESLTIKAAQQNSIQLAFGADPPPPVPGTAPVAQPQAKLAPSPPPPTAPAGPPPGQPVAADRPSGRQPFFQWFGETPLAWVGGGVTVLGLAGGVGFAFAARQSYDDANGIADQIRSHAQATNVQGPCEPPVSTVFQRACSQYQNTVDTADSQKTLSIVSFVVAGVGAAGTAVYYVVDSGGNRETVHRSRPTTATRATVVPTATPTEQGLSIVGTF